MTEKYSDPDKDELLDMATRFRTTYIDPARVEHIKERAVTELLSLLPTEPGTAVPVPQEEKEGGAAAESGPALKKWRSLSSFFVKKAQADHKVTSIHQPLRHCEVMVDNMAYKCGLKFIRDSMVSSCSLASSPYFTTTYPYPFSSFSSSLSRQLPLFIYLASASMFRNCTGPG